MTRAFLPILFCVLLDIAGNAGGQTPASRPSSSRATIGQVVPLPKITLHTSGHAPIDAFAMLAAATETTICPINSIADDPMGQSKPYDLWNARAYPQIDFDIDTPCFWQACDQLMEKAGLENPFGGDRWIVLGPKPDIPGLDLRASVSDQPAVRARISMRPGYHMEMRTDDEPPQVTDIPESLELRLLVDPRIRICAIADPVFEEAVTDDGLNVRIQTVRSITFRDRPWELQALVSTDPPRQSGSLRILRGYVPVRVVTKWQSTEIPLNLGEKKSVGPWTLEVVECNVGGRRLVSGLGWFKNNDMLLGMESTQPELAAKVQDIRNLVRLEDATAAPLVPFFAGGIAQPRRTVTNGIRQRFCITWARWDEKPVDSTKLVVDFPLEIEDAMVPFEFSNVSLAVPKH
jgi:hypothetical protein